MKIGALALALTTVPTASFLISRALAANTVCNVNASGGYANCLSAANPSSETVKGYHAAGLPYKMELWRPSDGAIWGPWTTNDLNYHTVFLSASGTIVEQVDNQGTANPAAYYVEMN